MSESQANASREKFLAARGEGDGTILAKPETGGVVEWLMAPVLKTGRAQALVGSNPTPSATAFSIFDFRFVAPAACHAGALA